MDVMLLIHFLNPVRTGWYDTFAERYEAQTFSLASLTCQSPSGQFHDCDFYPKPGNHT